MEVTQIAWKVEGTEYLCIHTETHKTLLNHQQTNQHAWLWNQVPWKNPLAKPYSQTGQTSSNVPATLLDSSKRPILLTSSVEHNVPGSSSKMPHNITLPYLKDVYIRNGQELYSQLQEDFYVKLWPSLNPFRAQIMVPVRDSREQNVRAYGFILL